MSAPKARQALPPKPRHKTHDGQSPLPRLHTAYRGPHAAVLSLQRTAGNAAVSGLMEAWRHTSRLSRAEVLARVYDAVHSSSRPLDPVTRAMIETRFGRDLGHVRVHVDAPAEQSAAALSANAYTAGPHIVFGKGRYAPGTDAGRRLLSHEVVHTLQQQASGSRRVGVSDAYGDAFEAHADRAAAAPGPASPAPVGPSGAPPAVQRDHHQAASLPQVSVHPQNSRRMQVVVGGVRIGTIEVSEPATLEDIEFTFWARQEGEGPTEAGIRLGHPSDVRVRYYPRGGSVGEVQRLLRERGITFFMQVVEQAPAVVFAHPEFSLRAPDVPSQEPRLEESVPARSTTARRQAEPEPSAETSLEAPAAEAAEEEQSNLEAFGWWLLAAIGGEFTRDPTLGQIGLDTGLGLIPIVDQVLDVRDVIAHLYWMIGHGEYSDAMRWVGVVLTLIGLIPELGTAIKGVIRFIMRGVQDILANLDEILSITRRLFPEGSSLSDVRRYITQNWDQWMEFARRNWDAALDTAEQQMRRASTAVSQEWLAALQRIRGLSPTMLTDAMNRLRDEINQILDEAAEAMGGGPRLAGAGAGGPDVGLGPVGRGEPMQMRGRGEGGGGGGGRRGDGGEGGGGEGGPRRRVPTEPAEIPERYRRRSQTVYPASWWNDIIELERRFPSLEAAELAPRRRGPGRPMFEERMRTSGREFSYRGRGPGGGQIEIDDITPDGFVTDIKMRDPQEAVVRRRGEETEELLERRGESLDPEARQERFGAAEERLAREAEEEYINRADQMRRQSEFAREYGLRGVRWQTDDPDFFEVLEQIRIREGLTNVVIELIH